MKKLLIIAFSILCFAGMAQNSNTKTVSKTKLTRAWFEAPEGTKGDTIMFKTSKHVLGPNDDPAFAWSEFELKKDNTFTINYWRWSPSGNYSYNGTWTEIPQNIYMMDFGPQKSKCELHIISVSDNELRAIIKEKN